MVITIIIDQYRNSCLFGEGDENISLCRSDDERAMQSYSKDPVKVVLYRRQKRNWGENEKRSFMP
jgi:hypothetical protein